MLRQTQFTNKIIDSLAYLTSLTDREQLAKNLLNNLYELLDLKNILLYKVSHASGKITCYVSAYIPVTTQDAGFSVQLGNLHKAQLVGNG